MNLGGDTGGNRRGYQLGNWGVFTGNKERKEFERGRKQGKGKRRIEEKREFFEGEMGKMGEKLGGETGKSMRNGGEFQERKRGKKGVKEGI